MSRQCLVKYDVPLQTPIFIPADKKLVAEYHVNGSTVQRDSGKGCLIIAVTYQLLLMDKTDACNPQSCNITFADDTDKVNELKALVIRLCQEIKAASPDAVIKNWIMEAETTAKGK